MQVDKVIGAVLALGGSGVFWFLIFASASDGGCFQAGMAAICAALASGLALVMLRD